MILNYYKRPIVSMLSSSYWRQMTMNKASCFTASMPYSNSNNGGRGGNGYRSGGSPSGSDDQYLDYRSSQIPNNQMRREQSYDQGDQIMLPRFKHKGVAIRPRSLAFTSSNELPPGVALRPTVVTGE